MRDDKVISIDEWKERKAMQGEPWQTRAEKFQARLKKFTEVAKKNNNRNAKREYGIKDVE